MYKQSFITILLTVLMSMTGAKAFASDIAVANDDGVTIYYVWNNYNTDLAVCFCDQYLSSYSNEYTGNVVIPESVDYNGKTYPVTSIGDQAFVGCRGLTSVTIPNSVTSIGINAFYDCSGLTSVTIPNSVTSIGSGAFYYCSGLTSVNIPNNVTSIGESAFSACYGLTTIVSDRTNPFDINENVFMNLTYYDRARLVVPPGTKSIYLSKAGWKNFENIVECEKKRTIHVATAGTLPNLIPEYEKSLLEELTLTGYLNGTDIACIRRMAGSAVNYDYDNGSVVEEMENNQIYGRLYILDISGATIVSGGSAYMQVWHGWPSDAPVYTDLELSWYTSDNTISEYMFNRCKFAKVSLPNNIKRIENSTFGNNLTEIVIPQSVTSIGSQAFSRGSGLTSVKVESGNKNYDSRNNCNAIIETSSNKLIFGCKNTVIPNSVTSIGNYAFSRCSGLTSVTIPNSVTSIGNSAFEYCSGLTSVTIPNSVTSIGNSAFEYCSGLTSVTIPNSVTSIASSAFRDCSGLNSIQVESGNQRYDSRNNCNAIIETSSNKLILGCKNTVIPNSVTSIGEDAFWGCSGLTSVTIPNRVTTTGNWAFSGCSGLTSIISLNDTPPTCPTYSFYNVDKANCVLWVPIGSVSAYKTADGWKDFQNIRELTFCDVNLDGEVNQADLDATVDFIMGKDPKGFYESLADLNNDDKVDAVDVVKLVTILNLQEGLSMDYQAKYSNQVISSLSCTLNNDGDKAIQLTKCELYCNHSVVSSSKFKVTLAKGESKKCSFDELESLSSITGFSVVWYYTYNGEDYTYCCEIEE